MLHVPSSSILHYGADYMPWQNGGMEIRERISKVLEANPNWSARSVSLKAGLSDSMLHKYLTGQTQSMSIETMEKVAKALDVDPRWLIFGDVPAQPDNKLVQIWDHIPERRRRQALRVLESFTDEGEAEFG